MRGGKFQQKSSEPGSSRNAEGLFETRSVSEIREVEARTRRDIEEKKEELRQLVGASYRDLIESADSILDMQRSCEAVVANISAMEEGFATLHKSIATSVPPRGTDELRQRREKLYGLGTRVKYLVDTPEKIWGCLDEHMYLEGAERYMRAGEVHTLLMGHEKGDLKELLASFPLIRHQWPLVETFKNQISQRSRDRLQDLELSVEQYAVALAGAAVIDNLNSVQIFALFLESRRTWVRAQLRSARSGGQLGNVEDATIVATSLCQLVAIIEQSLCHVGELFLEVSTGKMPLLFGTVLVAMPGSQLFGGIPNPEKEVELWKEHRQKLEEAMTPLPAKAVQEACQTWLKTVADDISVEGQVILGHIKNAKDLAEIEVQVRQSMTLPETFAESMPWLTAAFGGRPDSPWDSIWELLLKEPMDLWNSLFEKTFAERCKTVVDSAFQTLTITEQIEQFLTETKAPESVDLAAWGTLPQSEGSGGLAWRVGVDDREWESAKSAFFSPEVTQLRDEVDHKLTDILTDVLHMLRGPAGGLRSQELAPYLQEQCFLSLKTIVEGLEKQLESLTQGTSNGESMTFLTVERALLIGRFCAALGQWSTCLPVVLGPPSNWRNFVGTMEGGATPGTPGFVQKVSPSWLETVEGSTILEASTRTRSLSRTGGQEMLLRTDDGTVKLKEVQKELRRVSIAAHRVWVEWSTTQLAESFTGNLRKNETLATTVPLKGWEETIQKSVMEDGEVELSIALPAMPSDYCLSLLFSGAKEIHRIGSHTLDRAVLRLFAWKMSAKVLAAYDAFVRDEAVMNERVSEKGILQLLFDVKFLADVLSGGAEISPESLQEEESGMPGSSSRFSHSSSRRWRPLSQTDPATMARKAQVNALVDSLKESLDPIDWATYEEALWEHEKRCYNRCAVLYGAIIQLNRLHTDVPPKHPHASDTNTLNMAPSVQRFTLLPISAPLLHSNGIAANNRTRKSVLDHPSVQWDGVVNGEASKYSFSDSVALASVGASLGLKSNPLFKSIMGQVGSGALKLGSMVSDGQVGRNISTLGEMLPSQAAGLFSSLTTSAS